MSNKSQQQFEKERRAQMEFMRDQVMEVELQARYWKAQWEAKYYTLEDAKIKPEYDEYFLKVKEASAAAVEQLKELIENEPTDLAVTSIPSAEDETEDEKTED